MKVHELAKELEIQSKDVLTYLNENGIEVKAANSSVEDAAIEMVKTHFGKAAAPVKAEQAKEEVKAEEPAKIPTNEVIQISTTSQTVVSIKSIAGLRANTYGTINAPIASFVAVNAVFIGFACEIAAPA